jgi:hypothetical protein
MTGGRRLADHHFTGASHAIPCFCLDRATLEAFYIRGRSLKQMSRDFETPVGIIKRRLHVARKGWDFESPLAQSSVQFDSDGCRVAQQAPFSSVGLFWIEREKPLWWKSASLLCYN